MNEKQIESADRGHENLAPLDSTDAPNPTERGAASGVVSHNPLPADAIIVLPVRSMVMFPGVVLPISIGRDRSVMAAQEAVRAEQQIGIVLQRDPADNDPKPEGLYDFGTAAGIVRYLTAPDGAHHIVCHGLQRFRVVEWLEGWPFRVARVERIAEPEVTGTEVDARMLQLKERAREALKLIPDSPPELAGAIENITSPALLADMVASFMDLKPAEKQEILETIDPQARMDRVLWHLAYRLEVLRLSHDIGKQTRASMEGRQREYLLREQLKTIQKELGEVDEKSVEIEDLEKAIQAAGMPEEVEQQARKELRRLERMPEGAAEYGMARSYLDWLIELPWSKYSAGEIDIAEARRILDGDHYGLEKIKRRILEYLAVRKLAPAGKSPILCFVGPPGVGKTSLGQSIARATGRKFVRVALGGVHDEAEIRGHRRTYIGALPGIIIQSIRKAGTHDCVMMLDEIDKLGATHQGDPSSAMLEVLDPEQNSTFRDNYLGVPFDLSKVMFIATANMLDSIPGPLRDRMEVIQLGGYTEQEKLQIARRYLVRRQLEANGLKTEQVTVGDDTLRAIIQDYTREAGVRNLEREIGAVFRSAAMKIAEGTATELTIEPEDLAAILGPQRFESEIAQRTSIPGVATGLAWTPVGGDILFVEATKLPGAGRLILTGQLGDVMKESAQAALSLVKSRAEGLGIDPTSFEKSDIHVHVPAGAIPKDGPSAGVAMFTALYSLMANRTVRSDTAMTGEISLRGLVLPVGGIKEKVLAAHRAGIKTVMLPARNRRDYEDIPEEARDTMSFVWLDRVEDAIEAGVDKTVATTEPADEDGLASTP